MPFANLSSSFDRLTWLMSLVSVRTRIIVLALIPLVGFHGQRRDLRFR
jgi:hypothetical protein